MAGPQKTNILIGLIIVCVVLLWINSGGSGETEPATVLDAPTNNNNNNNNNNNDSINTAKKGNSIQVTCLSQNLHETAMKTIDQLIDRIWKDWDVANFPEFLNFIHLPQSSWDIQKHKFIKLILENHAARSSGLKNEIPNFVVGFSGSSITAGHDNYFLDAFPQKFLKATSAAFSALNISYEVRNHALGNNPCYPYDACVETHVGDDLDILTWEQSMNCGRDSKPIEHMMRDAMNMKKRPSLWFLLSGTPFWAKTDCANTSAFANRVISPAEQHILSLPVKDAVNSSGHMDAMMFLKAKDSLLHHVYSSTAPMGQNVQKLANYKCQGPYGAEFSSRAAGLPPGQTWHPGILGHKLKGDNLAFVLLHVLKDALKSIPACDHGDSAKSEESKKSTTSLYSQSNDFWEKNVNVAVPNTPLACDPSICHSNRIAKCFTDFVPRTKRGLDEIIVGEKPVRLNYSSVNDLLREHGGNNANFSLTSFFGTYLGNKWSLEMSFFDFVAVEKLSKLNLGYLDKKFVYFSHGPQTPLQFMVDLSIESSVWICELQKGFKKYPAVIGDLDKASEVSAIVNYRNSKRRQLRQDTPITLTLVPAYDQCYKTSQTLPPGKHLISVRQASESQLINIAYVMYW